MFDNASWQANVLPAKVNIFVAETNRSLGLKGWNSRKSPLYHYGDRIIEKMTFENAPFELPPRTRSTFITAFSPDNSLLASCHGDHQIHILDVKTKKLVKSLAGHERSPWCVTFHPGSNEILASGSLNGEVRVWDLRGDGSESWIVNSNELVAIASLSFHPYDHVLAIAAGNEIHFWDWSLPRPFASVKTNSENEKVRLVRFDPWGHSILTGVANAVEEEDETNEESTFDHWSWLFPISRSHQTRTGDSRPSSLFRYRRRNHGNTSRDSAYSERPSTEVTASDYPEPRRSTTRYPTSGRRGYRLNTERDSTRNVTSGAEDYLLPFSSSTAAEDEDVPSENYNPRSNLAQAHQRILHAQVSVNAEIQQQYSRLQMLRQERHRLELRLRELQNSANEVRNSTPFLSNEDSEMSSRTNPDSIMSPYTSSISSAIRAHRQRLLNSLTSLNDPGSLSSSGSTDSQTPSTNVTASLQTSTSSSSVLSLSRPPVVRRATLHSDFTRSPISQPISDPIMPQITPTTTVTDNSMETNWTDATSQDLWNEALGNPSSNTGNSPSAFGNSPSNENSLFNSVIPLSQSGNPFIEPGNPLSGLGNPLNEPEIPTSSMDNLMAENLMSLANTAEQVQRNAAQALRNRGNLETSNIAGISLSNVETAATFSDGSSMSNYGNTSDFHVNFSIPVNERDFERSPPESTRARFSLNSERNLLHPTDRLMNWFRPSRTRTNRPEADETGQNLFQPESGLTSEERNHLWGNYDSTMETENERIDDTHNYALPGFRSLIRTNNSGANFPSLGLPSQTASAPTIHHISPPSYASIFNSASRNETPTPDPSSSEPSFTPGSLFDLLPSAPQITPSSTYHETTNLLGVTTSPNTNGVINPYGSFSTLHRDPLISHPIGLTPQTISATMQNSSFRNIAGSSFRNTSGMSFSTNLGTISSVSTGPIAISPYVNRNLLSENLGAEGDHISAEPRTTSETDVISGNSQDSSMWNSQNMSMGNSQDSSMGNSQNMSMGTSLIPSSSSLISSTENISMAVDSLIQATDSLTEAAESLLREPTRAVGEPTESRTYDWLTRGRDCGRANQTSSVASSSSSLEPTSSQIGSTMSHTSTSYTSVTITTPSAPSVLSSSSSGSQRLTNSISSQVRSADTNLPPSTRNWDFLSEESSAERERIRQHLRSRVWLFVNEEPETMDATDSLATRSSNPGPPSSSASLYNRIVQSRLSQAQPSSRETPTTQGSSSTNPVDRNLYRLWNETAATPPTARPTSRALHSTLRQQRQIRLARRSMRSNINRIISTVYAENNGHRAVVLNIDNTTYRLQWWDFSQLKLPEISRTDLNVIVPHCKIYNDASIDISKDGQLLATFVPTCVGYPDNMMNVGVFSLAPSTLGQLLFKKAYGPNAVCLSISPLSNYICVGLKSKQFLLGELRPNKYLMAQILELTNANSAEMPVVRHIYHPAQDRPHRFVSINTVSWIPEVGRGVVYGTNNGELRMCSTTYKNRNKDDEYAGYDTDPAS